jgi:hypothetical protein
VDASVEYLSLYQEDCGTPTAEVAGMPVADPAQLEQVYALARSGRHLVAGTQGGAVIWDPEARAPVAVFPESICSSALTWGDSAWLGCDGRVLRWDGRSFTSFLVNDENDAACYDLAVGPDGGLVALHGTASWTWDPARSAFARAEVPGAGAYDVAFHDGHAWSIDFLSSILLDGEAHPLGSALYPGGDPRSFEVTADGSLWVLDFQSGVLRWDAGARAFEATGILPSKGTGVAVDPARDRLWALHHTQGPVLLAGGERPVPLPSLVDLLYMRDLLPDADGSAWIGGWPGLVHLVERGGTWVREDLRIRALPLAVPGGPRGAGDE